ncbi:Uncharacterised protein [Candidatus Anstonella stagnisolia]|nr:Uncharacterised protein [Candidatus Anstonella stagnisolia]
MKKFLFPILIALILFGCITVTDAQKIKKPAEKTKIFENVEDLCSDIGGPTPCTCMVCENKSSLLGDLLPKISENTLKGGKCELIPCNNEIFDKVLNDEKDNKFPQKFLLGQGASFAEFKSANQYCNNSLSLAVKWMVGDKQPPITPLGSRAACFLERNVIPLYIYYTKGAAISAQAATDIGTQLKDAGPVIVTTEINFDSSDASAVSKVKDQINAYKAACPKCLVALSPKDMDLEAVEKFHSDTTVWNKIDMIGQGIMLNKDTNGICEPEALIGKRMVFAKKMLNTYHKPTIWLYVGISTGTQDPDGNAGCTFTDKSVAKAYEYMMGTMQPLISSGVIGYSPYAFVDGTNPLECTGDACNFGLMDSDGKEKEPQFSSWFADCQYYTQEDAPSFISYSTNGLGNRCSYADNQKMLTRLVSEAGDVYEPPALNIQPVKSTIACDSCISYEKALPSNFGTVSAVETSMCTQYPALDAVPDRFDVSALLMRAIFAQESSFDACAISYVPASTTCGGIDSSAISSWSPYNTQACPNVQPSTDMYVDTSVSNYNDPSARCKSRSQIPAGYVGAKCKPCAFGISQCIELPGQEYKKRGMQIPDAIKQCGGENYNPFSPGDSACCGSTKLYDYIKSARDIISSHDKLSTAADKEWYEAYLALMSYHGGPARTKSKVDYYYNSGSSSDSCYESNKDTLVAYLSACVDNYPVGVLGKYQGLVNVCNTDCKKS